MFFEVLALAIVLLTIYWYLAKPKNLPPGPNGIPILGYLPWIIYCKTNNYRKILTYVHILILKMHKTT